MRNKNNGIHLHETKFLLYPKKLSPISIGEWADSTSLKLLLDLSI